MKLLEQLVEREGYESWHDGFHFEFLFKDVGAWEVWWINDDEMKSVLVAETFTLKKARSEAIAWTERGPSLDS